MKTRTLNLIALAAVSVSAPMLGMASGASVLERCVKAFMADLSNQTTTTLKLRDSYYEPDQAFMPFHAGGALTLTARDAHDNHAVGRAVCIIGSNGEVDLRAEPLVEEYLH